MKLVILLIIVLSFDLSLSQENRNTRTEVEYFNLDSALKSVLRNHKMIKATKNDVEAAKLRLRQSRGGFFPSLDVTANYGHENIIKYGAGNR